MAVLIPPVIADYRFEGEQDVARRLQADAGASEWIVLHSLDIASHRSQVAGECDFVVIIPDEGVLCLEVKGCKSLKVDGGLWYYGTNPQPDRRGPFRQASEAMYSVRNYLFKKHPELRNILFSFGVLFPFINFNRSSPEWHTWQVIGAAELHSKPLSQLLKTMLAQARKTLLLKTGSRRFDATESTPTAEQCRLIADTLCGHSAGYYYPMHKGFVCNMFTSPAPSSSATT